MSLILVDLETYNATTYANQVKAQAKLNAAISTVSGKLCFGLGGSAYAFLDNQISGVTNDYISVNANPTFAGAGTITLTKLTSRNATIIPTVNGANYPLTDAVPTTTITGLATGTYTVIYGDFTWTVQINTDDVQIKPIDTATGQTWRVFPLRAKHIKTDPHNTVYKVYLVDCNDVVVREVTDYTFDGSYVTVCNDNSEPCICEEKDYRLAVLADYYVPADLETVVFDLADAMINNNPATATLKREEIGSYKYEKFQDVDLTKTVLDQHKEVLAKYSICSVV